MQSGLDINQYLIDGVCHIKLTGSLDFDTTRKFDKEIEVAGSKYIILDMKQCRYISSIGLRSLLMAYKNITRIGGSMIISDVSQSVKEILEITGFSKILDIRTPYREISLEGCEFISAGVCGECYRLDNETIVKLYGEGIDSKIAEQEKKIAKEAFILGVPTAISYDIISCNKRFGIVYEMIDAKLFSSIIIEDLESIPKYAVTLSKINKSIHAIKGDPQVFPDLKERFRGYINQMNVCLNPSEISFLQNQLEKLPDSKQCVHSDLHTSNIMIRNNEPIIIDMGDFSTGTYLFDIGLAYTIYGLEELKFSELATKIPAAKGGELWKHFVKDYFSDKSEEEYVFFEQNKYFLGSLRLIYTITFLPKLREQLSYILKDYLLPKMKGSV